MWFNWLRADPAGHDNVFIEKVRVQRRLHPVDAFVVVSWALILLKCLLATWAIHHWDVPIHDLYVWAPSFIFGGVCTFLYLRREEEE